MNFTAAPYLNNISSKLPVRGVHFPVLLALDETLHIGDDVSNPEVRGGGGVAGPDTLPPVNQAHGDDRGVPDRLHFLVVIPVVDLG